MAPPVQMTEMFDSALLGILQHVGNIQDFLQIYFGFLYRKTDFYRLLSGPEERMGFPPGVAEKMVYKTYKLFEKMAEEERERRATELLKREEEARVPPVAQEEEVIAEAPTEEEKKKEEQEEKKKEEKSAGLEASAPVASSEKTSSSSPSSAASSSSSSSASSQPSSSDPAPPGPGRAAAERTQDFQADPDSYNGAVRENYSWSQDYTDVEVRVFVPKTVVKGRQVRVVLQSSSLSVTVSDGGTETPLLQGDFTHRINTETSLWSLEPGRCIVLSLTKVSEVWWNAVLKGEQEIDVNKINRERSMASVDEEEHAVLDRLSFDYHQKLQGKPQSHEMKVHDMLKKGWDAEGSPFKGQQFDPSMFDIPPSAVQF